MLRNHLRFVIYLILVIGFSSARAGAYEDFFRALDTDNASGVSSLLQRGFDPNSRDAKGQTALYAAMREGSEQVAAVLLAHPAIRVDLANPAGETPLMMAALKGRSTWVRRLIEQGAQVDRDGWTPLHYAAAQADAEAARACVQLLLARGARLDARSPNGTTPLMMAARNGSEAVAMLLLERGADPRLRNDQDLAAADFARQAGRTQLAAALAQAAR